MDKKWFYGIEGVEFIWRGSQSDPLVEYKGHKFNYWDLVDALYDEYKENGGKEDNEEEFRAWVESNPENVENYLDDWIFAREEMFKDVEKYIEERYVPSN